MTVQSTPSSKLWWLSINTNKDTNGAPVYIYPLQCGGGDIVRQKKIAIQSLVRHQ